MISQLAAIGFDPEIRGILVVGVGVIVLFGSVWMILATNSGIRLASLIALAGFFGWMVIMGAFWWIRGIGYVGESVSWHVLDFNRADPGVSSVEPVQTLPDPLLFQGKGFEVATALENDFETLSEFTVELDRNGPDYAEATDAEFADAVARQELRNATTTVSQVASVSPAAIDAALEQGMLPDIGDWEFMNTSDAGEAQSAASAAILEKDGFHFESATEFRFLDAFRTGGKPRLGPEIDPDCTFCGDNLRRGWHWIANSARIKNPTEYAVIQLQAIDAAALVTQEGQAPPFPVVDEDAPIISVVMVRDLGNLRFPPAMVTLGSLLIFVALCYMLHLRDESSTRRIEEYEAAV